jgi:hypothetical protein
LTGTIRCSPSVGSVGLSYRHNSGLKSELAVDICFLLLPDV